MKRVVWALAAVVCAHAQPDLAGNWQGTIQAGGTSLRLLLHVAKTEGRMQATLDSLDQGVFGLKVTSVRLDGATLRFDLESPAAQYHGDWDAAAGEFRGNWFQSGASLPLAFRKAAAENAAQAIGADDREFLLGWLRRTEEAYAAALDGLTPAQWKFKPSPARWSIAECGEHLVIAERDLFKLTTERIARMPLPDGRKRLTREDDERMIRRMTDRSKKVEAAESERPKGVYTAPADALRDFRAARAATLAWAGSTQQDLRGHGFRDQGGGFTDAYQLALTIAAHTARHLAQIDEVKADPKYPRSQVLKF